MFREAEGIDIFKVSGDIAPDYSSYVSYCLFSRIGTQLWHV